MFPKPNKYNEFKNETNLKFELLSKIFPMQSFFSAFLLSLNAISLSVIIILSFMSFLSWYLIISKALHLGWLYLNANKVLKLFWRSASWQPLMNYLARRTCPKTPFTRLALQAINAAVYYDRRFGDASLKLNDEKNEDEKNENENEKNEKDKISIKKGDFLTRNLRRAIAEEAIHLETGLTILAIIGSTAPFIGLFGTVLGIHDALLTISHRGTATLDTVAAPVGEALIMTAFGLIVAIPAVIGYNLLLRIHRILLNKLEGFAHDLHTCLTTGARMDMKNTAYMKHQIEPN